MTKLSEFPIVRYGFALFCVVVAIGLRLVLDPVLGDLLPFATLFIAILIVASSVGRNPALFATAVGGFAAIRWLLPPRDGFRLVGVENQVGLLLYLAISTGIALVGGAMRTARARIEASLAESRRQQEQSAITLASIGDAVMTTDLGGLVVSMNPIAESLTGWSAADAKGRPLDEVFRLAHETSSEPVESPVSKVFWTGQVVELTQQAVLIARDGVARHVNDYAVPIRDDSGAILGVVLVFRDDTTRRLAEQTWKINEARNEAILRSALDGIITIDHEGRITEFNPAAERIFGYSRSDVTGHFLSEVIIPPSLRLAHRRGMAHFLDTGEGPILGQRIEVPAIRADGREIPVELTITKIEIDGPPQFTAYLRDISDRKRAEATIAEQIQLVDYGRSVGLALTQSSTLSEMLGRCAEATVTSLDAAFARIWTVNPAGDVLELHASAGLYTHIEGGHSRIPVGQFKIGRIAQNRKPHLTNQVIGDPQVPSQEWARQEGMVAFAGYPLIVDDRLVGVLGLFARHPLSAAALKMMGSVANEIALGIERKLAEESLYRHQEWLQVTLASIGDAVIATDTENRVTFLNSVAEPLTGWSQTEAVGVAIQDVFRIINESTRLPVENPVFRVQQEGGVARLASHTILIARDGSERPIEDTASAIRNRSGQIVGVVLVFRDATARRISESILRESESKFRGLAEAMPQIIFVSHADQSLEYTNNRWFDYTGLTPDEAYAPDLWERVVHPDDLASLLKESERAHRMGDPFEAEYRLKDRSGAYRWHLGRSLPVFDESGKLNRRYGTATDIDDRKRAEHAAWFLAQASASLAGLVEEQATLQEVAQLAIPFFADWCTIELVGKAGDAQQLAVANSDPLKIEIVRDLHRRFSPEEGGPRGIFDVFRTGQSLLIPEVTLDRLQARAKNPAHLAVLRDLSPQSLICVPLTGRGGNLGALTFVSTEPGRRYGLNDLRLAEDLGRRVAIALENARFYGELKDADRRKNEFLATLAHELRNPLAPIRNTLHLMGRAGGDLHNLETERAMAERHVVHLARLIDDLMDVARISRGRIEIQKEVVDLATIIDQAAQAARPQIEKRRHELVITLPDEPIRLEADPTRLEQIFWNLLNNAAKYTEPGGKIVFEAERVAGEVVIRVRDNGIGIVSSMLSKVFDMFVQVGEHMEHAQGGLGIGLSLVRSLVEVHGGTITANSEGEGLGSEFLIRLPAIDSSEAIPDQRFNPGRRETDNQARHRILVVDDNVDAANTLAKLLRRLHDQDVKVSYDGPEALRAADEYQPEVILLDIGLPGMSGYDVARILRSKPEFAKTLIVALTGWGQEDDRRRSAESGIDSHLVKPVNPDVILDLLNRSRPESA